MIRKAKQKSWLLGLEVSKRRREWLKISYLLYRDDPLVFCDAKVEHLRHLSLVFSILKLHLVSM